MGYSEYYMRAIDFRSKGFKLVLGGTGLGKTRGIRQIIKQKSDEDGRKFVYVANRIQLLNEMYNDLIDPQSDDGIDSPPLKATEVVHLERNRDTVLNAFSQENRDDFFSLLQSQTVIQIATKNKLDVVLIHQACKQLRQIQHFVADNTLPYPLNKAMDRDLETYTREIKTFFRIIVLRADDDQKKELINHPIIQVLFPFIAFAQNPSAKILLVTIHKGFLGFFDGFETKNLMNIKNCIMFLDEFDFLENDLIQLICESPQIEDPFLFVEMFYRAMATHKLPLKTYPFPPNASQKVEEIQDEIFDIVKEIGKLEKEKNIPFPTINQFTTQIEEKHAAIFQTNRMVLQQPLYLQKTERSFEIVRVESEINALELFNTVQWATHRILFLFNKIATISSRIYDEMLTQCFPQSYLADQVRQISHFPHQYKPQYTRLGNLLSLGFGLYEIQDLEQITDRDEVKFRLYSIHMTPERAVLSMAQNNLVFGLSATADIPRFVKHFNIAWLKRQLIDTSNARFFEIDEVDESIIQELNKTKALVRKNPVELVLADPLSNYHTGLKLTAYIRQIADHFLDFGGDDPNGYRRARVENFFALLNWIIETKSTTELEIDTHLVFFNSFHQVKYILSNPECHEGTRLFDVKDAILQGNEHFSAYRISFLEQNFNVVFYDAEQAKHIENSEEIKKAYHQLFWENVPVIVITQYASAGNGVNLQYRPSPNEKEKDFLNIHLLDKPFFFFDQINPKEQKIEQIDSAIKKNIWYQAKLYEGKVISSGRFFNLLENIRNYGFNGEYNFSNNVALTADSLKNRMAMYIQALGRIERVWLEMKKQTVRMTLDVFDDFAMFYTNEENEALRDIRLPRISNNLKNIISQVQSMTHSRQRKSRRIADERLASREAQCRSRIHELLQRLENLRMGANDDEAKYIWLDLRRAALQHDFANSLLEDYSATFSSQYYNNGTLYIDSERKIYPPDKRPPSVIRWRLNSIYDVLKENKDISTHFLHRGFELEFSTANDEFFTPYFYQAILVGAIGEEAIERLLKLNLIPLDREIPNRLFELADLKVSEKPWFIDCKNYSERTLDYFALPDDDPAYRPFLGEKSFEAKVKSKLQRLRYFYKDQQDDCKLIYLNLVSSSDRVLRYINTANFYEDTSFDNADVIIVQGIVNRDEPEELNKQFYQFIEDLKYRL